MQNASQAIMGVPFMNQLRTQSLSLLICWSLLCNLLLGGTLPQRAAAHVAATESAALPINSDQNNLSILAMPPVDLSGNPIMQGASRPLIPQTELEVVTVAQQTDVPNQLTITIAFRNATTDQQFRQLSFQPNTTTNVTSSTEPTVTDADLGGDGILSPGETTTTLTFVVNYSDANYIYLVNAYAIVEGVNQPLTVALSATPRSGTAPLLSNFTASINGEPGTPVNYTWTWGDGDTENNSTTIGATGVVVLQLAHSYSSQGSYEATFSAGGNGQSDSTGVTIDVADLTTIAETSPINGEDGVASTRETIVTFSGPLNPATVTDGAFSAEFAGLALTKRLQLSSDQRRVTLFYDAPLPGSSRVRVTVNGNLIQDAQGVTVDADGDGAAGGSRTIGFDTLGLTVLTGTSVCGRVFASELAENNPQTSVNVPLEGATITVDGRESELNTTTDSMGNFCLDPAPVGRFFVHVDGRTAINGVPAGAYYPFVGKTWQSRAGQQSNVGDVYLPLVTPGTLQPVSATQDTEIGFSQAVLNEHPEFADVKIVVPANSLFSDDGTRGGMVGIAPVPPDRLPGELPEGLHFPVVITVQTDGPTNFDEPVPVCFPNLPDPETGQPLAPGAKDALYSFDHDTGRWAAVGSMTVTEDGMLVCTDPGVGVVAPGWHGNGPEPVEPPPQFTPTLSVLNQETCNNRCTEDGQRCSAYCSAATLAAIAFCGLGGPAVGVCVAGVIVADLICQAKCVHDDLVCLARCQEDHSTVLNSMNKLSINEQFSVFSELSSNQDSTIDEIRIILNQIQQTIYPYAMAGTDIPEDAQARVETLLTEANTIAGGDAETYVKEYLLQKEKEVATIEQNFGYSPGNAPIYPVLYMAEIYRPNGVLRLRGNTGPNGQYSLFIPRDGELLYVSFYDLANNSWGVAYPRQSPAALYPLPNFYLKPVDESFTDFDDDSLADVVELAIGTIPNNPDTDNDGILDGTEVQNGTDPLDGLPAQIGIIATADTPGNALDICAVNESTIAVAHGQAGVAIFNVFNGMNPNIIAQVDIPGNAQRMACTGNLVAIADDTTTLHIIDVADPAAAQLVRSIELGRVATALDVTGDILYVGLNSGEIATIDLATGNVIDIVETTSIAGPIYDLSVAGGTLAVYGDSYVELFDIDRATPIFQSALAHNIFPADATGSRLFNANPILYLTHFNGYLTIDISDPTQPAIVNDTVEPVATYHGIVTNGSGNVLATYSRSFDDWPVALFDGTNPNNPGQWVTEFATPGQPADLAIANGLAYIADGTAGLQVINYLAYDSQGNPPEITVTTNYAQGVAEENTLLRATAHITEDVQIRNVAFYLDDVRVVTDVNFPFEFYIDTPTASTQPTLTLQAQATDTGGNSAWSEQMIITLVPDGTPPNVVATTPISGTYLASNALQSVAAVFSEDINPATLTAGTFQLVNAGVDQLFDTADDLPVTNGVLTYNADQRTATLGFPTPLPDGRYRAQVTDGVEDAAGNSLAPTAAWEFTVGSTGTATWDGGGDGYSWNDANNWTMDRLPGPGDAVTIMAPVGVSIEVYGFHDIYSLQSNVPVALAGGVLRVATTVQVDNEFTIIGGELIDATVLPGASGQGLTVTLGTIDNLTMESDLVATLGGILVQNGLTVNGNTTLGNDRSGSLNFDGTQILTGTSELTFADQFFQFETYGNNTTLTIGPNITLRGAGGYLFASESWPNNAIINYGRITADLSGSQFTVAGNRWENYGVIEGINGGTVSVGPLQSMMNAGTIDPALNFIPLSFAQFTQESTGHLIFQIGGLGDFNQLQVTNQATLDGTLAVELINGYEPDIGDTFEIITAGTISGQFATVNGLTIGNGKQFSISYTPTTVQLEVVATP